MGRKRFFLLISLAIIFVAAGISCGTGGKTTQEGSTSGGRNETFDPRRVSQAQYVSTRDEVQHFIEDLNSIIRNRNFEAWKACLSQEYFADISSQENLRRISQQPAMRSRQIVLRTAEDYFIHVVVASRAESGQRVDDIEFIGVNRVHAFTITTNRAGEEVRLRLYDLEKINNSWTIIN